MDQAIELNWWREAFEAAGFAKLLRCDAVRLSSHHENVNGGFDFEVEPFNGEPLRVQSTLVDFVPGTLVPRVREWSRRLEESQSGIFSYQPRVFAVSEISRRVSEEASKKSKKSPRYKDTALLLHLNMSVDKSEENQIPAALVSATFPAAPVYRSVWVLQGSKLRRCHPDQWCSDVPA